MTGRPFYITTLLRRCSTARNRQSPGDRESTRFQIRWNIFRHGADVSYRTYIGGAKACADYVLPIFPVNGKGSTYAGLAN
jgi:hypothetical protein